MLCVVICKYFIKIIFTNNLKHGKISIRI